MTDNAQSKNHEIAPIPNIQPKQIAHSISPRAYPYP